MSVQSSYIAPKVLLGTVLPESVIQFVGGPFDGKIGVVAVWERVGGRRVELVADKSVIFAHNSSPVQVVEVVRDEA